MSNRKQLAAGSGQRTASGVLLSVDVEPWTETKASGNQAPGEGGEAGLGKALEAMRDLGAKATFFVLGSWADKNKSRVREIASEGHEVASHGYHHKTAGELGPDLFLEEARRSKNLLEDASGTQVVGYRCPNWGISPKTPWALPALKTAGFRYDASVNSGGPYPVIGSWPGAIEGFRGLDEGIPGGSFGIFVNGAWRLGPWTFPWSVALALRILPLWFLKGRIEASKQPALSLHSWEFDPPQQKVLGGLPALSRAALSWGAGEVLEKKLANLLEGRNAVTFRDALGCPA